MSLFLPNPCLLGVFLTVSTYDGPQLVFHYPPKPNEYGYKATPLAQDKTYLKSTGAVEESSSSSSESDGDDSLQGYDDEFDDTSSSNTRYHSSRTDSFNTNRSNEIEENTDYLSGKALLDILDEQDRKRKRKEKRKKKLMENMMKSNVEGNLDNNSSAYNSNHTGRVKQKDELSHTTSNTNKVERLSSLTKLFGFEIDLLTELITPPKKLCNTRFEVTIDDMSFLGLPIHVHDDGKWKISNKTRTKSSKRPSRKSMTNNGDDDSSSSDGDENDEDKEDDDEDDENGEASIHRHHQRHHEAKKKTKEDKCPMNMFHLVFAMNPPVVEYNHRIDEMYHYIISRLTLVLRYEQHKSNFIYDESMKIMSLKEANHDLSLNDSWFKIIKESSLANIIYQTYNSVSNNDIVNLDINGKTRSFQIPIKNEFSTLPPTTVSILRGSYLSSINPLYNNSLNEDNRLLANFALLLLDDPEIIVKDIQAEKDSIIANFIRMIKPTESLNKLSTISGLELNQIFSFSFHLVLWRRAIAIPPLQTRNIYVISPLAPMKNLMSDAELFKLQFQSLPSLPVFLSMLSPHSKPRPYSSLLPSRDHRELYLEALAWLIKTGYALQLHTFLWLKITNKIKVAVDEEIEMENFKKREHKRLNNINNNSNNSNNNNNNNNNNNDNSNNTAISNDVDNTTSTNTIHNNINTRLINENETFNNDNSATLRTDNLVDNKSQGIPEDEEEESRNQKSSVKKKLVIVEEEDTILLDPERATALERRWISKIIEGKPPELATLFYRILKYFNGKDSLEMLPVKENISRTDLKKLLSSIDEYIVSVKHW